MSQIDGVARRGYGHARDVRQIGEIKQSVMGGAVFAHEPGAVNGEDNRQFHQSHVMDDVVVGTLEKRRVYCHVRDHAVFCEPSSESHRMAFRYPDVECPLGESLAEL